jgi:hypothetical protein
MNKNIQKYIKYKLKIFILPFINYKEIFKYLKNSGRFRLDHDEKKMVLDLKRNGFLIIKNYLKSEEIDALSTQFEDNIFIQENICPSSLDADLIGSYNAQKILLKNSAPIYYHAKKFALTERIVKIVCSYFGAIPLFSISVYRSTFNERRLGSRNFHRDDEGMLSCFIYLTDMSSDKGGPLTIVPGTDQFSYRSFLPLDNLTKSISSDNLDYEDEEIEKYYPKQSWRSLLLEKGDLLMVDVSAFHKGPSWGVSKLNHDRDTIQFNFTLRRLKKNYYHSQKMIEHLDIENESVNCFIRNSWYNS